MMWKSGPEGLGEEEVRRIVREETMKRDEDQPLVRQDEMAQDDVPPLQVSSMLGPTPLGLAAFALTMFLLSLINAGWLEQIGTFIPLAFFYGGLVQLLAGVWAFRTNNTFGAVVFTSYGAFWLGLGFLFFFAENLAILADVGASVGWTLLGWTVFTLYVWIASTKVNRAVFIMFSTFMITLVLLDVGFLVTVQELIVAGGYTGILFALCAWYVSAAGLLNLTFGRTVLPLGAPFWEGG